jgi:integrase
MSQNRYGTDKKCGHCERNRGTHSDHEWNEHKALLKVVAKDRSDVEEFLDGKIAAGKSAGSVETYGWTLARISKKFKVRMTSADRKEIIRVMGALQTESSVGSWLVKVLMSFLRFHGQGKKLENIPRMNGVHAEPVNDSQIITRPELGQLLAKCTDKRDEALLLAMWDSGARVAEVLALDVGDLTRKLDAEGKKVIWEAFFRKSKVPAQQRAMTLYEASDAISKWIRAHPSRNADGKIPNDAPLFTTNYGGETRRMSSDGVRYILTELCEAAGIHKKRHGKMLPVNPHAFRHGRVTDLVSRRAFEPAIKRRAGWTKGSAMIFRYTHIKDRDLDDSIGEALGIKTLPEPAPVARIDAIESGEIAVEKVEAQLMERFKALLTNPEFRKMLAE